ncbi:MAG: RNA ligase family protein [Gammaproteobacteria bacterium]|nr:RNA ligase family protein [Gammaproteobacteria bacterium]
MRKTIPFVYAKIHTLWKREEKKTAGGKSIFPIVPGEYSKEEFKSISNWTVSEKIHGTNIRVVYNPYYENISFLGKTDKAELYSGLLKRLESIFNIELFRTTFPNTKSVQLFGEGYGSKIQKGGGRYLDIQDFALFDVCVDGWWLNRSSVEDIGNKMNITTAPVFCDLKTVDDVVSALEEDCIFNSAIAVDRSLVVEGFVARSEPLMLFRNGDPIMFKLKVKDYQDLKKYKAQ